MFPLTWGVKRLILGLGSALAFRYPQLRPSILAARCTMDRALPLGHAPYLELPGGGGACCPPCTLPLLWPCSPGGALCPLVDSGLLLLTPDLPLCLLSGSAQPSSTHDGVSLQATGVRFKCDTSCCQPHVPPTCAQAHAGPHGLRLTHVHSQLCTPLTHRVMDPNMQTACVHTQACAHTGVVCFHHAPREHRPLNTHCHARSMTFQNLCVPSAECDCPLCLRSYHPLLRLLGLPASRTF